MREGALGTLGRGASCFLRQNNVSLCFREPSRNHAISSRSRSSHHKSTPKSHTFLVAGRYRTPPVSGRVALGTQWQYIFLAAADSVRQDPQFNCHLMGDPRSRAVPAVPRSWNWLRRQLACLSHITVLPQNAEVPNRFPVLRYGQYQMTQWL